MGSAGLEYRNDALRWTVDWGDVVAVEDATAQVTDWRELLAPAEPIIAPGVPERAVRGASRRLGGAD